MPAKVFGGLHAKPNDSESPISWGPEDGSYAGLLPIPCQRYENGERQAQDRKMPCLDFAQSPRAGGAMGRGQMDLRGSGKMSDMRQDRPAQGRSSLAWDCGQTQLMSGADETDKRTVSV